MPAPVPPVNGGLGCHLSVTLSGVRDGRGRHLRALKPRESADRSPPASADALAPEELPPHVVGRLVCVRATNAGRLKLLGIEQLDACSLDTGFTAGLGSPKSLIYATPAWDTSHLWMWEMLCRVRAALGTADRAGPRARLPAAVDLVPGWCLHRSYSRLVSTVPRQLRGSRIIAPRVYIIRSGHTASGRLHRPSSTAQPVPGALPHGRFSRCCGIFSGASAARRNSSLKPIGGDSAPRGHSGELNDGAATVQHAELPLRGAVSSSDSVPAVVHSEKLPLGGARASATSPATISPQETCPSSICRSETSSRPLSTHPAQILYPVSASR
ncbi:hypothetical protein AURDEDRAFT_168946 [Auricularia subglabra TFB-10046 SS5]|nr:hypothetical protein AURDEDRAFT_168946 [Auricularia subglabra TFB-10046 SS5]